MIISASRRTDIPGYYADWFFNRVAAGYALVRNPMNFRQIKRIALNPENVDCFVFWTKFPVNFSERLHLLKNYNSYFHFTLTPYETDIEPGLPDKMEVIEAFKRLSEITGRERIIWRYDPILLSARFNTDYHLESFTRLCHILSSYTARCTISFYQSYRCTAARCRSLMLEEKTDPEKIALAAKLSAIAESHNLTIESCAQSVNMTQHGILAGKCIDDRLIKSAFGLDLPAIKDQGQRRFCGCIKSVDIGSYSTCISNCLYCYASKSPAKARERFMTHDPTSAVLGEPIQI